MVTEQQQKQLQQHAIENLELSVKHAQDWVNFYLKNGPAQSLTQWENTLLYREALLRVANEHAATI